MSNAAPDDPNDDAGIDDLPNTPSIVEDDTDTSVDGIDDAHDVGDETDDVADDEEDDSDA